MVVPGSLGRLMALQVLPVSPLAAPPSVLAKKPAIAAVTRKGSRWGKSVNEDAFLVTPLAQEELWLLAVADGVSRTKRSWWASHKCMELLWRSKGHYEQQLLDKVSRNEPEWMRRWLDQVHQEFLDERSKNDRDSDDSTSTLCFVVVRGYDFFYAMCGDSRLYTMEHGKSPIAMESEIRGKQTTSRSKNILNNHIAADSAEWNLYLRTGSGRIVPGGMLLLCSDGAVTTNDPEKLSVSSKFALLHNLSRVQEALQEKTEAVVNSIAELGEQDDITLLAFRP
jgi:serine/threonine protein phosphatase PrpC